MAMNRGPLAGRWWSKAEGRKIVSNKIFKAQILEIPGDITVEFIDNIHKRIKAINDDSLLLLYESFKYNTKNIESIDVEDFLKEKD